MCCGRRGPFEATAYGASSPGAPPTISVGGGMPLSKPHAARGVWTDQLSSGRAVPPRCSTSYWSGRRIAGPPTCKPSGTARPVGIVTYSAQSLTAEVLAAAGADPVTPVAGVEPHGYFAATIRDGAATLDRARMAADVVSAAQALAAARPDIGAIVLECANMPPYRDAVAGALRIPVFDMVDLVSWFYAGAARRAPAHVDRDLW